MGRKRGGDGLPLEEGMGGGSTPVIIGESDRAAII